MIDTDHTTAVENRDELLPREVGTEAGRKMMAIILEQIKGIQGQAYTGDQLGEARAFLVSGMEHVIMEDLERGAGENVEQVRAVENIAHDGIVNFFNMLDQIGLGLGPMPSTPSADAISM